MSNGNGTSGPPDSFRVSEPGAVPTTQPQPFTHVVVEMKTIQKLFRFLERLVLDGQEAAELIMAVQQSRPIHRNEIEQQPEDPAMPGGDLKE